MAQPFLTEGHGGRHTEVMPQHFDEPVTSVDVPSTSEATNGRRLPDSALWEAAHAAHGCVEGCDGVSVSVVQAVGSLTVAGTVHTSEAARELESVQTTAGEGPALEAIRQLQVFNVPDLSEPGPWPELSRAAEALGVRSAMFVPIVDGGRALGSMSFYSSGTEAFAGWEQQAIDCSAVAARALS
jgi:GAF domain-containing protein